MNIVIDEDEEYPFYSFYDDLECYGYIIEITEDEYSYIKNAKKEYEKYQSFLRSKLEKEGFI